MRTTRTPAALPAAAVLGVAALALSPGCGPHAAAPDAAALGSLRPTPPPVQPPRDFGALASYPLPLSLSASHALQGWNPDGKGHPSAALSQGGGLLPVSLAYQTSAGDAYYTADVNRVTCRAEQGAAEWLGTHLGVKAVDRKVGEVRHYTRRDGLPGDCVEAIAADDAGVYCVVRAADGAVPAPRVALCALEPAAGRWKTLCQVAAPPAAAGGAATGRLALTPDALVFAPPVLGGANAGAALYVLDRGKGTLRALAPAAALRAAGVASAAVSFLASDGRHGFVGTDAGLFTAPLGGGAPGGWRRSLPEATVDAGCLTADGRTLWLAYHDRHAPPRPAYPGGPGPAQAPWDLCAVAAGTGRVTPAAPEAGGAGGAHGTASTPYYPCAVSVGPDAGAVWVTWAGPGGFGGTAGGFDRYDPAAKRWDVLALNGTKTNPAARLAAFGANPLAGNPLPALPRYVPDVAVLRLAEDLGGGGGADPLDGNGQPAGRAEAWTRMRFPEWLCRNDVPPTPAETHLQSLPDPAQKGWVWVAQHGALCHVPAADLPGYRPDQNVIATGTLSSPRTVRYPFSGGTVSVRPLVRGLAGAADGGLVAVIGPDVFRYGDGSDGWKALTVPAADGGGVLAAGGDSVVPGAPDGRILLRRGNEPNLYRLDPGTTDLAETGIAAPSDKTHGAAALYGSSSGVWWASLPQNAGFAGPGGPQSRPPGAAVTLHFVPLGPGARGSGPAEEIAPGTPPGWDARPASRSSLMLRGVVGDVAWFLLQTSGQVHTANGSMGGDIPRSLIGYDRVRRSWTAPLELEPFLNSQATPTAGPDGAAYVCGGSGGTTVYRYDPGANAWQAVTPPLPERAAAAAVSPLRKTGGGSAPAARPAAAPSVTVAYGNGIAARRETAQLIACARGEFWAIDGQRLYAYDRAAGRWTDFTLPAPLRSLGGRNPYSSALTASAVWLGSANYRPGLWRFDRRAHTWREVDAPLTIRPATAEPPKTGEPGYDTVNMEIGAADARAVWGAVSPNMGVGDSVCFRFDRRTHAFTLYGRAEGLPVFSSSSPGTLRRMVADGDALWLLMSDGTYRLDPATRRCVRVFDAGRAEDGFPAPAGGGAGAPRGDVAAVTPDPADPRSVYLLLGGTGGAYAPNAAQPVILYRYRKGAGRLEPLPVSASVLRGAAAGGGPRPLLGTPGLFTGGDPAGSLWVGTTAGVCRVDRRSGAWAFAALPPGVPGFAARRVFRDGDGALWLQGASQALRLGAKAPPPSGVPVATARR